MAYIKIINDSGSRLLDDSYQNMAVQSSGTVTTGYTTSDATDYYPGDYPSRGAIARIYVNNDAGAYPLVGVRSGTPVAVERYTNGGQTVFLFRTTDPASFQYWVFAVPNAIGGNGLVKIYNAAGVKTFDSDLHYARIVGRVDMTEPGGSTPPAYAANQGWVCPWAGSYSFDSSRTHAAVQIASGSYWDIDGRGSDTDSLSGRFAAGYFSGETFVTGYTARSGADGGGGDGGYDAIGNLSGSWLIFDVTGY
jgi:hypothetical protein